jgi:hypothetical protein
MDAETYFKEYREWLNNEIKRLYCYFYVYKRIHERFEDRLEEINLAPCFFQTVIDGLFSAIILWIDKLTSRSSERGLYNFLNFVRSNIGLFSVNNLRRRRNYSKDHWMVKGREAPEVQSVDEDIKRIEGLPSIKSISLRRDKFHAHFDKEYFFDRKALQKEAPILRSDLETILGTIKELVNKYSANYDGSLFHYQPLNVNDIDIILDRLHGQDCNLTWEVGDVF